MVQAKSFIELRAAIYKREGWTRVRGESQNARIVAAYDIVVDQKSNRLIATKKAKPSQSTP